MRARVGWVLRWLASKVDPNGEVRLSGLSFTFERGRGSVIHGELGKHVLWPPESRARGCPLVYDVRQYDRAHTEAENPT